MKRYYKAFAINTVSDRFKVVVAGILLTMFLFTSFYTQPVAASEQLAPLETYQGSAPEQIPTPGTYLNISVQTAHDMIGNNSGNSLLILDVRYQCEYDMGHLYGAVLMPYDQLQANVSKFQAYKNQTIIVYCRMGARSNNASKTLVNNSFTRVYLMMGGIIAWIGAGYQIYTTQHYATVNMVNGGVNLRIDPALLDIPNSYLPCFQNQSSTCSTCDKIRAVISGNKTIEPTITLLSNDTNQVVYRETYVLNGSVFNMTVSSLVLWRYNQTTDKYNRSASIFSTTLTWNGSSTRMYNLVYQVLGSEYNFTLQTLFSIYPSYDDIIGSTFTIVNLYPAGVSRPLSSELVSFNSPIDSLSHQYAILSYVAENIGQIYGGSGDQNLTRLATSYHQMGTELGYLSNLIKGEAKAYDMMVLGGSAILSDSCTDLQHILCTQSCSGIGCLVICAIVAAATVGVGGIVCAIVCGAGLGALCLWICDQLCGRCTSVGDLICAAACGAISCPGWAGILCAGFSWLCSQVCAFLKGLVGGGGGGTCPGGGGTPPPPPPPPDFTIALNPPFAWFTAGATVASMVSVESFNGFSSPVTLTVWTNSPNVGASLSPNGGTPTFTSTLEIVTAPNCPAGTYTIVVRATGGGLQQISVFTLSIASPAEQIQSNYPALGTYREGTGSVYWNGPSNIIYEDNVWANTGEQGTTVWLAGLFGGRWNIPSDAVIDGVQVAIKRYASVTNSTYDDSVYLRKPDGSTSVNYAKTGYWSTSVEWAIYGGPTDCWGVSLTPYDVNNLEVDMSCHIDALNHWVYVDDYYVWIIYHIVPLSDVQSNYPAVGTYREGTGSVYWNTPSRIQAEDGVCTTINDGGYSVWLAGYFSGRFNIPSNAIIDGVRVAIKRYASDANSIHDCTVYLRKPDGSLSANYASSDPWSTGPNWAIYGGPNDRWGLSLTPYDVNNLEVDMSCQNDASGHWAYVDDYYVWIFYHTVPPTNVQSNYPSVGRYREGIGAHYWNGPPNIQAEDGVYSNTGEAGSTVWLAGLFGGQWNIPSNAIIDGVQVAIKRYASDANSIYDETVYLRKPDGSTSANYAKTGPWSTYVTWVIYGGPTDCWGLQLTPYDVNNLEVDMNCHIDALNHWAYVDDYYVWIFYHTVPPTNVQSNYPSVGRYREGIGAHYWNGPPNIEAEDNYYANTGEQGTTVWLAGLFAGRFNIPSNAIIDGVQVAIKRYASVENSICDDTVYLRKPDGSASANYAKGGYWSTSVTYAVYGGPNDCWGLSLTPDDVNNLEVDMNCRIDALNHWAYVDDYYVSVYYHLKPLPLVQSNYPALGTYREGTGSIYWNTPSNIQGEDNVYTTVNDAGYTVWLAGYFDGRCWNIPSNAIIDGVQVAIKRYASDPNSVYDYTVYLRKPDGSLSANYAKSGYWSYSVEWAIYGGPYDCWGLSLTPSDVNNLEVDMSCHNDAHGHWACVDDYYVWIYYHTDVTPPTTTISPSGTQGDNGWYRSDVTVSLTSTDATSGVAMTIYSFDGSIWLTYSGPFPVSAEGTTTVYYYSTDNAGNKEDVKTTTIKIDKTPPQTTIDPSGTTGLGDWYVSDVTFSLIPADGASGVATTSYRINGGAWITYAPGFVLSAEGIFNIEYYSTDKAGNVEATKTATIMIDKAPPTTSISLSGTQGLHGWYRSDVMVSLSRGDATSGVVSTFYRLDGSNWLTYSGPFPVSAEGATTVYYYSTDKAGNVEATESNTILIDKTPPTTWPFLYGIEVNGWFISDVWVYLNRIDLVSGMYLNQTVYSFDQTNWYQYPDDHVVGFKLSTSGVITVYYRTTDVAGNVEGIGSTTIQIDKTPPVTSISPSGTLGLGGWYLTPVTITLTASDQYSGVSATQYSFNELFWNTYEGPITITSEGISTIYYRSADNAGNIGQTQSSTIRIDKSPPSTNAGLGGTLGLEGWYKSDVTVTLAATDDFSGISETRYSYNKVTWIVYDKPLVISAEGLTTVYYRSIDVAGNTETWQSTEIWIDKTPPTTTASLDGEKGLNDWFTTPVIITLSATDGFSGVKYIEYSYDEVGWTTCTGPFTIDKEGATMVTYRSIDEAGNIEVEKTETIMIDKTAAKTTETHSGTMGLRGWYVSDVTVTLCATDGISGIGQTLYCLDGLTWQPYVEPLIITDQGTIVLQYRSIDNAGNEEPIKTQTFMIDKTAPVTSIIPSGTPGNQGWFTSDVIASLLATDDTSGVAKIMYSFDGITWYTYYCSVYPTTLTLDWLHGQHCYVGATITLGGDLKDCTGRAVSGETVDIHIKTEEFGDWVYLTSCTTDQNGHWQASFAAPAFSCLAWLKAEFVGSAAYEGSSAETPGPDYIDIMPPPEPEPPIIIIGSVNTGATASLSSTMTFFGSPGPFIITDEGVITIYYYSVDAAGNPGDQKTATIKIDKTAPESSESHSGTLGSGGWYVSDVVITLEATDHVPGSDAVVIEYGFYENDWEVYKGAITVMTEGANTIHYRAIDLAGNVEAEESTTIWIDKTKPVSSISLSGTQGLNNWFASDVNVALIATDGFSGVKYTEYSYDGSSWTTYTPPLPITTEGTTTIYYRSVDAAGNTETSQSLEIRIDKTPPTTTVSPSGTQGDNDWYKSDVMVSLTRTDTTSGVARTAYSIDGVNWLTYSGPFPVSAEGTTTVYYNSTDNAGNTEVVKTETIMIDKTPPTTKISLGGTQGQNGWYNSDVIVFLMPTDATSGVADTTYSFDGSNWIPYTPPLTITTEGTTTIYYRSVDVAGNTETLQSLEIMIDKTPPTTTCTLEGQQGLPGWFISDVSVTLSAQDQTSGVAYKQYSLDNEIWSTYEGPFIISYRDITTVYYRSVDVAGNVGTTESVEVKIYLVAQATIGPQTLNLKSKGQWVTVCIELPQGYNPNEIDISSVELRFGDKTIHASWGQVEDGVLMVKFDRAALIDMLSCTEPDTMVQLEIWGEVAGCIFVGTVMVRVI